jgi:hypothetical protein
VYGLSLGGFCRRGQAFLFSFRERGVEQRELTPQELASAMPTDAQHPVMYERAVYLLGLIGVLAVAGLIGLAAFDKQVSEGLVAIGAAAVGGIVGMLKRG